eukprot:g45185.t1
MPVSVDQASLEGLSTLMGDLSNADLLVEATRGRFGNSTSAIPDHYAASLAARGYLCGIDAQPSRQEQPSHWNAKSWQSLRGSLNRTVQLAVESRQVVAKRMLHQMDTTMQLPLHFGSLFQHDLPWMTVITGPSRTTPWINDFSGKYDLRNIKESLGISPQEGNWASSSKRTYEAATSSDTCDFENAEIETDVK